MNRSGDRLGRRPRAVVASFAAAIVGVLVTARCLSPDPRGFGTHTQLGLGDCSFLALMKKPCPSCGMTTAFAWSMRGRSEMAWRANPAGSVLAPACVLIVPWLLAVAVTGRPRPFRTVEGPLVGVVLVGVGISLASWAVRLLWLS